MHCMLGVRNRRTDCGLLRLWHIDLRCRHTVAPGCRGLQLRIRIGRRRMALGLLQRAGSARVLALGLMRLGRLRLSELVELGCRMGVLRLGLVELRGLLRLGCWTGVLQLGLVKLGRLRRVWLGRRLRVDDARRSRNSASLGDVACICPMGDRERRWAG